MNKSRDQDRGKGATEQNPQDEGEGGNTSMKVNRDTVTRMQT